MQASHWSHGIAAHRIAAHRIAAALIIFGLSTTAPAADKRPFASSDFTSLRSAMPVAISPDGKTILFDVQSFDEKGPAKHEWHTIAPAGGADSSWSCRKNSRPPASPGTVRCSANIVIDDQTQLAIVPIISGIQPQPWQADDNFLSAARQPRASHFTRWREDRRPFGPSCKGQTRSAQRRRER